MATLKDVFTCGKCGSQEDVRILVSADLMVRKIVKAKASVSGGDLNLTIWPQPQEVRVDDCPMVCGKCGSEDIKASSGPKPSSGQDLMYRLLGMKK